MTPCRRSAFGLASRYRSSLRSGRTALLVRRRVAEGGEVLVRAPRVDTPYAPTRCRQSRTKPRRACVTCDPVGVTAPLQSPLATRVGGDI